MFERPRHQRIALVLYALDGALLRDCRCMFGGGTAISLRHGEYRESVAIDLLTSNLAGYRRLRESVKGTLGLHALQRKAAEPLKQLGDIRADQYGIRTALESGGERIKFEIVFEARIQFDPPSADGEICGVPTLSDLDLAASKLLANSDRWRDEGVFSRDLIDLAMMALPTRVLRQALARAQGAYGESVLRDLGRAIDWVGSQPAWLAQCMAAMAMPMPRAVLWQKIRALRRLLPKP